MRSRTIFILSSFSSNKIESRNSFYILDTFHYIFRSFFKLDFLVIRWWAGFLLPLIVELNHHTSYDWDSDSPHFATETARKALNFWSNRKCAFVNRNIIRIRADYGKPFAKMVLCLFVSINFIRQSVLFWICSSFKGNSQCSVITFCRRIYMIQVFHIRKDIFSRFCYIIIKSAWHCIRSGHYDRVRRRTNIWIKWQG